MTLLQPELVAELAGAFPDAVAWRNLADGSELTLARLAPALQPPRPGPAWSTGSAADDRVGLLIGNDEPLRVAGLVPRHPQGGRGGGAALGPARPRRARPDPARTRGRRSSCAARSTPRSGPRSRTVVSTGPGGTLRWADLLSADDADLPTPATARTTWPTSCTPRGPPAGPRASSCGTAGSRRPDRVPVGLAGARLPLFLALRHDQRVAPRLRPPARRAQRVVPAALRPGRLDRRRRAGPPGRGLPRAGDGGAHRRLSPLRDGRPLEPGRGHRRQRADCRGHPAPLRRRACPRRRSCAATG